MPLSRQEPSQPRYTCFLFVRASSSTSLLGEGGGGVVLLSGLLCVGVWLNSLHMLRGLGL